MLVAHGRADESVEVESARSFREALAGAGTRVTWVETGGGHELEPAWYPEIHGYLSRVI